MSGQLLCPAAASDKARHGCQPGQTRIWRPFRARDPLSGGAGESDASTDDSASRSQRARHNGSCRYPTSGRHSAATRDYRAAHDPSASDQCGCGHSASRSSSSRRSGVALRSACSRQERLRLQPLRQVRWICGRAGHRSWHQGALPLHRQNLPRSVISMRLDTSFQAAGAEITKSSASSAELADFS